MKYDYFAEDTDKIEKRRRKSEKRASLRKFFKVLLITLGVIVIVLAATWALLRYVFVDFYFQSIIPDKQVASYIDENIIGKTTTQTTTEETQTQTTLPVYESMTYLDSAHFDFQNDKKGNFVGNILNGGKVAKYNSYAYHVVDGDGIYRFNPYGETYELFLSEKNNISSLNVHNGELYFVEDDSHYLCNGSKDSYRRITPNIKTAYIYDGKAYCTSTYNQIMSVDTSTGDARVLFSAKSGQSLELVGVSLERVFFTLKYENGRTEYLTVDTTTTETDSFMTATNNDSVKYMSMENGYLYYCLKQTDGSYNLVRQKFGSPNTVTLVENKNFSSFAITDSNRVFYSFNDGGTVYLNEYNMNSREVKTMLTASGSDKSFTPGIYHSGEYDFIIGGGVYRSSSNLTSSTDVMTFSNGRWNY